MIETLADYLDTEALQRQVDQLWPGLTAVARDAAEHGVVIGVRRGEVRLWYHQLPGGMENPWQREALRGLYDVRPAWAAGLPETEQAWPPGLLPADQRLFTSEEKLTPVEAAVVSGMAYYWCLERGRWVAPRPTTEEEWPLPADEARQAAAYLRREWYKKGSKPHRDFWPWRCDRPHLALNGPTEGPEARWFSTAYAKALLFSTAREAQDPAEELQAVANALGKPRGRVAAAWDWTRYALEHGDRRFNDLAYHETPLPWPGWADELTAERRLLQRAAELLYDANPAWRRRPDARPEKVTRPPGEEWLAIERLLVHLARDEASLEFTPERNLWGVSHRSFPTVALWAVTQGLGHLRRCAVCGRWVVRIGQRPRTLCGERCKTRRHRHPNHPSDATGDRP